MRTLLTFAFGLILGALGWHHLSRHKSQSEPPAILAAPPDAAYPAIARSPLPEPGHPLTPPPVASSPLLSFPVDRTVTNHGGVSITARLLARNATEVRLVRLADNATFHYPIAELSPADRVFLDQFPETILPALTKTSPSSVVQSSKSAEEIQLLEKRRSIERDMEGLRLELSRQNSNNPKLPFDEVMRRLDACRDEIITIDQELVKIRR